MGLAIVLVVVIGVFAVIGACVAGFFARVWWLTRTSPHFGAAVRLNEVVKATAEYRDAETALRAFDELVELAKRYPSEPLLHHNAFRAAFTLMSRLPHKLTAERVEALIAYAEGVIDARPDRRITRSLSMFLWSLGLSLAHTQVARELHDRLRAVHPGPDHIWPPAVYDPPVRPAPYCQLNVR